MKKNKCQNAKGIDPRWMERYQQLKEYYDEYGDCNVPHKYKENPPLGRWVNTQRQFYKNNKLSQERVDLLNQLGFVWDLFRAQWQKMYQQLKKYYERNQHSNVPIGYKENPQLARWVSTQRRVFKEGNLSQDQIELLNQLSFDWDGREKQWQEMYHQLQGYYRQYQHSNVPVVYNENPQLATWVVTQRQFYKNNKLSQERIDLLNQVSFDWDPFRTQWQKMYQQLKEYYEQNQHSNVPVQCEEKPQLGLWVSAQRRCYKQNKLSQEKIDLLNELNFNWRF